MLFCFVFPENGKERYAFDRFVAAGRAAGFIPDKVTLLTDTTWAKGAGAVQDTYTLIRKAIRKLLQGLGYATPSKRRGLSPRVQALIATYVEQNQKAEIDWSDPEQRAAQLQVLVQDAEAVLDMAVEHSDDDVVRVSGWLLAKILGDDIVWDDQGEPHIGQGTAADRIISVTDPEMRHGRKSRAHRFDGFKVSVGSDLTSDMILDVADVTAAGGDGQHLLPTVRRTEAEAEVTVERAIGDGACGSGANLEACAKYPDHPIDLVTPCRRPADPEVDKSAFAIDLEAKTATCPGGHTVAGRDWRDSQGRPILGFVFARDSCEACHLFDRCVRSKTKGRTVRTSAHEAYLQALELCERFAFRVYRWLERPAYTGQTWLFRLGNQLFSGTDTQRVLAELRRAILRYCPDQRFQSRFEQEDVDWYQWRGLKYLLYEYEQYLADEVGQAVFMPWQVLAQKQDTLEHILPQTFDAGGYWAERFTAEEHRRWVQDIGNLTLTFDNSALGNKPFPDKKGKPGQPGCYAGSRLLVEQEIARNDDWTPETIQARKARIAAWAKVRWHVEPVDLPVDEGGENRVKLVQRMIARAFIPRGQMLLYKVLYEAGEQGVHPDELVERMGIESDQLAGVLGALGRRVNYTEGLTALAPGTGLLVEWRGSGGVGTYVMRPELRAAIEGSPKLHDIVGNRSVEEIARQYREVWDKDGSSQRSDLDLQEWK